MARNACSHCVIATSFGCLCVSTVVCNASDDDWVEKHIVVTTTEAVTKSTQGEVTSISTIEDTVVSVKRKLSEISRKDKLGNMRVISRKTDTYDGVGNSVKIVEGLNVKTGELVTKSVTTLTKEGSKTVTTIEAPNAFGKLIITRRTISRLENGEKITTVEVAKKNGELVVLIGNSIWDV